MTSGRYALCSDDVDMGRVQKGNRMITLENETVTDTTLKAGDLAPWFQLPNASGRTVRLADLLHEGPVVVNFYLGGWNPYCNLALSALQASLPQFRQHGAHVVAVSPQTPERSRATAEENALSF